MNSGRAPSGVRRFAVWRAWPFVAVLAAWVPAAVAAGQSMPAAGQPPGLTSPLATSKELEPLVRRMWEASPTFRRQCARLDDAGVTIVIGLDSTVERRRMHAFTRIDMAKGLVRAAATNLRVWEPDNLAHEMEHVLELVDGVELRRSARSGVTGVFETQSGVFETARAIAIGRLVAREIAESNGVR